MDLINEQSPLKQYSNAYKICQVTYVENNKNRSKNKDNNNLEILIK